MTSDQSQPDSGDGEISDTRQVDELLSRLRDGDENARERLVEHSCQRLTVLTRAMMQNYGRVRRWAETDDILQSAMIRLHRALQEVHPSTKRDFINFAAVQIRRELVDLSRKHFGPEGMGRWHHSDEDPELAGRSSPANNTNNPLALAELTEIHEKVDDLPDELREVFDLHWYQDLSQGAVAELLNVSRRTVIRRWRQATLMLRKMVATDETGIQIDTDEDDRP